MKKNIVRIASAGVVVLALAGIAMAQFGGGLFKDAIKIIGVGAAVTKFGPQINAPLNKLTGHKDTNASFTKVVPIITVGLNSRGAIGAAQVIGAKKNVEKVKAVAQVEGDLFGEIKMRGLVPVSAKSVSDIKSVKAVDGVGVSGIVDLRL